MQFIYVISATMDYTMHHHLLNDLRFCFRVLVVNHLVVYFCFLYSMDNYYRCITLYLNYIVVVANIIIFAINRLLQFFFDHVNSLEYIANKDHENYCLEVYISYSGDPIHIMHLPIGCYYCAKLLSFD